MEDLHGGTIENRAGNERPFTVRKLGMTDLGNIMAVQKQAVSELDEKCMLEPLAENEYTNILEGKGLMIGAFVGEALVAFRALMVPDQNEEHLGRDIGLEEDDLEKVIYQEISIVLPEYRGNKLQMTLAILIMQELNKLESQSRYVCSTVAPFNIPSLKDKFAQGMEVAALKEKYNSTLRYVFVKDLARPENRTWDIVLAIPMEDIASQQEKINEGWRGFQIEQEADIWYVYYGKESVPPPQ